MTCTGLYEIQLRLQSKSFAFSPWFLVAVVCTFFTCDVQGEFKLFARPH